MSEEDEQMFKTAEECHICGQKYLNAEVRVRDHCHITGKYRGSAHQDCNLKLRISAETFKLPVIFHNLRGYDSHFIMQEIGAVGKNNNLEINCIPNNTKKFMAFMLGNQFGDKRLPPKEQFYSILTDEGISDEQYQHAQKVWDTFGVKTMGKYHNLYLESDILLSADVFENFRETCL